MISSEHNRLYEECMNNFLVNLTDNPAAIAYEAGCEDVGGAVWYLDISLTCTLWNGTTLMGSIEDAIICLAPACTDSRVQDLSRNPGGTEFISCAYPPFFRPFEALARLL
jgi:hypothetical protein